MAWLQLLARLLLSGSLVVGAGEVAKKNDVFGALIASLPLISILTIIWLYNDTGDTEKISQFSIDIFWLVIPSLLLFATLPFLLHRGIDFWPAFTVSIVFTIFAYVVGLKLAGGIQTLG